MNKYFTTYLLMIWLMVMSDRSVAASSDDWDPSRIWSEMQWQIRYLLFVDTAVGRVENIRVAQRRNADDRESRKVLTYLDSDELLAHIKIFATPEAPSIGSTLLEFDKKGDVITNDQKLRGFTGKLSRIGSLVLMRKQAPTAKPYDMLDWSQGIPGNSSFGPSPCTYWDSHRYQDDWKSGE